MDGSHKRSDSLAWMWSRIIELFLKFANPQSVYSHRTHKDSAKCKKSLEIIRQADGTRFAYDNMSPAAREDGPR